MTKAFSSASTLADVERFLTDKNITLHGVSLGGGGATRTVRLEGRRLGANGLGGVEAGGEGNSLTEALNDLMSNLGVS